LGIRDTEANKGWSCPQGVQRQVNRLQQNVISAMIEGNTTSLGAWQRQKFILPQAVQKDFREKMALRWALRIDSSLWGYQCGQ
jgi:hypothetical protein